MAVVFRISCHNDQIIFTINRNAQCFTTNSLEHGQVKVLVSDRLLFRIQTGEQTDNLPLVLHKKATYFTRFICVNQYNYL